ncbi:hypothetical protein [Legionella sp. WA2022007384]
MQSKCEELVSKVTTPSLYAARAAKNISNAAKHIFFPTPEESNVPLINRVHVEFERKASYVAEDIVSLTIGK